MARDVLQRCTRGSLRCRTTQASLGHHDCRKHACRPAALTVMIMPCPWASLTREENNATCGEKKKRTKERTTGDRTILRVHRPTPWACQATQPPRLRILANDWLISREARSESLVGLMRNISPGAEQPQRSHVFENIEP